MLLFFFFSPSIILDVEVLSPQYFFPAAKRQSPRLFLLVPSGWSAVYVFHLLVRLHLLAAPESRELCPSRTFLRYQYTGRDPSGSQGEQRPDWRRRRLRLLLPLSPTSLLQLCTRQNFYGLTLRAVVMQRPNQVTTGLFWSSVFFDGG